MHSYTVQECSADSRVERRHDSTGIGQRGLYEATMTVEHTVTESRPNTTRQIVSPVAVTRQNLLLIKTVTQAELGNR